MEYVIDSEMLIQAIEKRPLIWDNTNDWYKDRNRRREAWIEICEIFFDDLDTKEEAEKIFISKQVELKWRHIRDNFKRDLRARARSHGKTKRRYIYSEQLEFLRRYMTNNSKSGDEHEQEDVERGHEREQDASIDNEAEYDPPTVDDDSDEPVKVKKKRYPKARAHHRTKPRVSESSPPFEESMVAMSQAEDGEQKAEWMSEENDDMAFFRSLAPLLAVLTPKQKINFRIDVMQHLIKYHDQPSSSNLKFEDGE